MEFAARTAVLLALTAGPGFGLELIERVRRRSGGAVRLNRGGTYLALRALEGQGLVRAWTCSPRGAGRPRRYYELTPPGIAEADRARNGIRGLLAPEGPADGALEAGRMAERLRTAVELHAFSLRLREAGRRAGLSG